MRSGETCWISLLRAHSFFGGIVVVVAGRLLLVFLSIRNEIDVLVKVSPRPSVLDSSRLSTMYTVGVLYSGDERETR